jgi:hypothetical protein
VLVADVNTCMTGCFAEITTYALQYGNCTLKLQMDVLYNLLIAHSIFARGDSGGRVGHSSRQVWLKNNAKFALQMRRP